MNNREIKFRVWNKKVKQFLFFHTPSFEYNDGIGMYLVPDKDYSSLDFDVIEDSDFIIQQFTNIKDSTGKDIYEGDIIQDVVGEFNTTVFWDLKRGEWVAGSGVIHDNIFHPAVISDSPGCGRRKIIVGNIFETPNLM